MTETRNCKVIKTYKTGTKLVEGECPRCDGTGIWTGWGRKGGTCFRCEGSGIARWNVYTEEHLQELEEQKLRKLRKEAPEKNRKMFKWYGLNENGSAWVAVGNTFAIKEELKAAGAKFNSIYGWHFDHDMSEFKTVEVTIDKVSGQDELGYWSEPWDVGAVNEIKAEAEKELEPERFAGEYVGNIKDRLTLELTLVGEYSYETNYSYYGGIGHIYTMKDDEGNTFVWKTSNFLEVPYEGNEKRWDDNEQFIKKGERFKLIGTVKEHSEYRGVKQTVLTRCKVV